MWLCGCTTLLPSALRTPENRLGLGARLDLTALFKARAKNGKTNVNPFKGSTATKPFAKN